MTNPVEPRMFDLVVSNLRKTYPKDNAKPKHELPFHLFAPSGQRTWVEVGDSGDAEGGGQPAEEGDNKIGGLWGLGVRSFRPPSSSLIARELTKLFLSGLPGSKRRP